MKRTESKSVISIIAAVAVALLAGCASVPSADFQNDLFSEAKTYSGGEQTEVRHRFVKNESVSASRESGGCAERPLLAGT